MKKLFMFLFIVLQLFLQTANVYAGDKKDKTKKDLSTDPCANTPYNCNLNLVNPIFSGAQVKTTSAVPLSYGKS